MKHSQLYWLSQFDIVMVGDYVWSPTHCTHGFELFYNSMDSGSIHTQVSSYSFQGKVSFTLPDRPPVEAFAVGASGGLTEVL